MKRLSNFTVLWLSGLALLGYVAGHYAIGPNTMKFIIDTLLLGASVMITLTWGSAAVRAFRKGASDDVSKIVLTIWMAWAALLIQRVYVIVAAWLGRPQWLTESPIAGLVATTILIAGCYALVAPSTGEDVPKREIINLVIAAAIGGVITGIVIGAFLMRGAFPLF